MQSKFCSLVSAVQRNCDVSDAQFAGDYTLCVYLLKMREFYRWSKGLPLGDGISSGEVGLWVDQREAYWEGLLDQDYSPVAIDGVHHLPLESEAINAQLLPQGYVYGGGLGRFSKPYFFLAELLSQEALQGYTVLIAGREYARELAAPPAMAQGTNIYIRRESLRRMLWEKVEDWRWRKRENAMARAIGCYGFDNDLEQALECMTQNELETVILHEIGEVVAGELLGNTWNEMLLTVSRTSAEMLARAVRDLLADCLSALPALLDEENQASLHFYFANLSPLRKDLFPALEDAYRTWLSNSNIRHLKTVVRDGKTHWLAVAGQIVDAYDRYRDQSATAIEKLVNNSRF